VASARKIVRRGPYRMTAKRKTALRKAQMVSARKRKGRASANLGGTSFAARGKGGMSRKKKVALGGAIVIGTGAALGTAYAANVGYKRYGGSVVSVRGYHGTYGRTFNGSPRSAPLGTSHRMLEVNHTRHLMNNTHEKKHFVTIRGPELMGLRVGPSGGVEIGFIARNTAKRSRIIAEHRFQAMHRIERRKKSRGNQSKTTIKTKNPFSPKAIAKRERKKTPAQRRLEAQLYPRVVR